MRYQITIMHYHSNLTSKEIIDRGRRRVNGSMQINDYFLRIMKRVQLEWIVKVGNERDIKHDRQHWQVNDTCTQGFIPTTP